LRQRLYYVLNTPEDGEPYFGEPALSTAHAEATGFYVEATSEGLLVTRAEPIGDDDQTERAFVEFFTPDSRGGLALRETVNIPGHPVKLANPTTSNAELSLYTIEPIRDSGGTADIHRVTTQNGSATIAHTLTLPGYHIDLAQVGDFGVQVAGLGNDCTDGAQLTSFSLAPELEIRDTISLGDASSSWHVVLVSAPYVVLEADNAMYHYLTVEVASDGSLDLRALQTSSCSSRWNELRIEDGAVTCN
jgi:hypothetical protein